MLMVVKLCWIIVLVVVGLCEIEVGLFVLVRLFL